MHAIFFPAPHSLFCCPICMWTKSGIKLNTWKTVRLASGEQAVLGPREKLILRGGHPVGGGRGHPWRGDESRGSLGRKGARGGPEGIPISVCWPLECSVFGRSLAQEGLPGKRGHQKGGAQEWPLAPTPSPNLLNDKSSPLFVVQPIHTEKSAK